MPDPRNDGHGGPERVPSYGHQFGAIHDRIVGDQTPDESFYSKVSNAQKAEYVCRALRLDPKAFNLDLPLPLEDWALSDDVSLLRSGLFLADMRRQFYATILREHKELERTQAWQNHAEAEFWNHEFNRIIAQKRDGALILDPRTKH